ncbi:MAG: FAD-dependent oxidoreductase [Armatimonadetes bacterium]|nr:FAD-dependent oxidoreductase [Armatimonadota bacterium]MDE2205719.1 FAD-dependent oxidoreductase [Armatimonadota bacterium]
MRCQVLIVGGGVGGCAASLAASRHGLRVVMTEETAWIGGQLTNQAVPPDEHPWIETHGCTAAYRSFRERVRAWYRTNRPLTEAAAADPLLNPGAGLVSRLCCEPRAALGALTEMLAPWRECGALAVLTGCRPHRVAVDGDRVTAVIFQVDGEELAIEADWFVDATETGELLELGAVEHVVGAEARSDTGEPHAPTVADPLNQQAITMCFAVEYRPGEDWTIDRPADYARWGTLEPLMRPAWPGKLLSLTGSDPVTLTPRTLVFDPEGEEASGGFGLWRYRRIAAARNLIPGQGNRDVSLINWPMNDYFEAPAILPGADRAAAMSRATAGAESLSWSLLYWLQTEAPRPDGGAGWPGLRMRPDVMGTETGMAMAPYIRESRRIRARATLLEQHLALEARMRETGLPADQVRAADFPDSIGIGSYRIDLHPTCTGDNYLDVASLQFQIPLGALLPVRVENLLPGCKNLGSTHITNGCTRLHPVEWCVGEAAGQLCAFCISHNCPTGAVHSKAELRDEFLRVLDSEGVERRWR